MACKVGDVRLGGKGSQSGGNGLYGRWSEYSLPESSQPTKDIKLTGNDGFKQELVSAHVDS